MRRNLYLIKAGCWRRQLRLAASAYVRDGTQPTVAVELEVFVQFSSTGRATLAFLLVFGSACSPADPGGAPAGDSDTPPSDDGPIDGGPDTDPGSDSDAVTDSDPPGDPDVPLIFGLDARPPQATCLPFSQPPAPAGYYFADRFPGLHASSATAFSVPTGMFHRPNDNTRFYVTERTGRIKSFSNDPTVTEASVTTFLDVSAVTYSSSDCSLSAIAFPPDFATSRVAYVSYCFSPDKSASPPHVQVRVSRFHMAARGDVLDPATEQVILAANYRTTPESYPFPTGWRGTASPLSCSPPGTLGLHGVDVMRFGKDGYLYMTIGDGGPQGVCGGASGQDLTSLRGKMLRYDVSDTSAAVPTDEFTAATWVPGRQYLAVTAPADNPFYTAEQQTAAGLTLTDATPNPVAQLIYAYGFRNPWQWHFDSRDDSVWIGDVGNNGYEEIDRRVVKGGNYGWGYYEGYQNANDWTQVARAAVRPNVLFPVLEYPHASGIAGQAGSAAITGGVVYRGTIAPAYSGAYFFGDYSRQRIWAVNGVDALGAENQTCTATSDCSSGLVCKRNGRQCDTVDKVCPDGSTCNAESKCESDGTTACIMPFCYDGSTCDLTTMKCADAEACADRASNACATNLSFCEPPFSVVARPESGGTLQVSAFAEDHVTGDLYAVLLNKDFQGAKITRFEPRSAAPTTDGGAPPLLSQTGCFEPADITQAVTDLIPFEPAAHLWSDAAEKRRWFTLPNDALVTLDADGDFVWPDGSVLVKEFSLGGKIVETRFLVKQRENGRWAGYSYAWNEAQTDAELVGDTGRAQPWPVPTLENPDATQAWQYPGRGQCFHCHTDIAGTALGLEASQLNHAMLYEVTGRAANQMDTLAHIGVVDTALSPPPYADLAYIADATRSVEDRARSYLHANCSGCHRPDGPTFVDMDLRYEVAFADMNICNASPLISDMEEIIPDNPRLFAPGDIARSEIYQRILTTGKYRMPPIGRSLADTAALDVLKRWIEETVACE